MYCGMTGWGWRMGVNSVMGFLIVMGILTISGWGFDGDGVRFGILTTSGGGGNLTVEGIMVERDNGRGNGGWR